MTPLRQSMLDAMVTRGFADRTQESYVEAVWPTASFEIESQLPTSMLISQLCADGWVQMTLRQALRGTRPGGRMQSWT